MDISKNKDGHFCPLVSIIILNFNGANFIKNCLTSLLNITYPNFEIIFIDNCSTDKSLELLTTEFKQVPYLKIFRLNKNIGYAGGNNFGSKYVNKCSKYLLFLNIDTEVTKNFLDPLVEIMEDNPLMGAVQPKILLLQEKTRIDSMGAFMDVIGMVHNLGGLERDSGQYNVSAEVFYAKGAALFTRKSLFEKVRGFDEDTFLYRDEVDLCWKIRLNGFTIVNVPCSIIYHYGSAIIKKFNNLKMDYFFIRNNVALLLKNYSLLNVFRYLSLFVYYQLFLAIYYIIKKRDMSYFKYFCESLKWNILNLKITISKRNHVQFQLRKITDCELFGRVISRTPFFIVSIKRRLSQLLC